MCKLNTEFERIRKCAVWNFVLYAGNRHSWADRNMCICRKTEQGNWVEKISNEKVLAR